MPYVDNRGVHIHYEVEGSGPPVVLQHGLTDSIAGWRQFGYVDALKDSYRLILVDARGHGASDKPHDPVAYEMELRASDVVAVLDELGVERTHYVGYSMGGRIGFDVAALAPGRLRSLLIGGSHPYAVDGQVVHAPQFRDGMGSFLERQPLPEQVLTPSFRARMLANDAEALIAASVYRPGLEGILPTLTMPCLAYVGEDDPVRPQVEDWAKVAPHATLAVLPGLDHWAGMYRGDLVLRHLQAFLERATSEPAPSSRA
jgi:pimeloyl-ACP methyl ester carboxylesterase